MSLFTHSLSPVESVLLALLIIVGTSRIVGALFKKIHQPAVIGEVIAGILLGPSFLGLVAPSFQSLVFPQSIHFALSTIAEIGVILFMFMVGLELDTSHLVARGKQALVIAATSIGLPLLLGIILSQGLFHDYAGKHASRWTFAFFCGVALSVTAFPVLARILIDRKMQSTKLGSLVLTSAAFNDLAAWCLLAILVALAKEDFTTTWTTLVLSVFYLLFLRFVVRPVVVRWVRGHEKNQEEHSQTEVAWLFIGLLASSLITEAIGIHAIFGAFAFGAIVPHDSRLAQNVTGKIGDLALILFLPTFFALTGLRTQLGLIIDQAHSWAMLAVFAVACIGKIAGSFIAARLVGLSTRESLDIGVLMNTRGLMELIVLNVGMDLGILSPELFAIMVIMALGTTLMTTPLLQIFHNTQQYSTAVSTTFDK